MQITQDNHASSVIEAFEHRGVVVLIHEGGKYPSVTAPDGRCTTDCPHIAIGIYDYPHVTAIAGWRHGRPLSLPINDHLSPKPSDTSREGLIAYGKSLLDAAVDALPTIAQQYDAADEIYRWAQSLPVPLSRETYEAECAARGIAPRPDDQLSRWGDFGFPQYGLDVLPRKLIDQRRAISVAHAAEVAAKARAAEDRKRHDPVIDAAMARPVTGVVRRIEAANYQHVGQKKFDNKGVLWVCVATEVGPRISEDDPSIHGEHLLGSEGERGLWVTWELR